jgi:hypothetical protein
MAAMFAWNNSVTPASKSYQSCLEQIAQYVLEYEVD